MKFKTMEVYTAPLSVWWMRPTHPLFKYVMAVNPDKRPQFKYKLVKGGVS
ncbi:MULTISPECIES: hypothetical protein [Lactococcus]|nr:MULTISPECIES: hypothetical protein [Lactococcus]